MTSTFSVVTALKQASSKRLPVYSIGCPSLQLKKISVVGQEATKTVPPR
jgi:hypothetical protein